MPDIGRRGPLLAVLAASWRRLDQPNRLQRQPRDGVAKLITVPLTNIFVEMLGREVGVFFAMQPPHPDASATPRAGCERFE
jgi:hypothetical protein